MVLSIWTPIFFLTFSKSIVRVLFHSSEKTLNFIVVLCSMSTSLRKWIATQLCFSISKQIIKFIIVLHFFWNHDFMFFTVLQEVHTKFNADKRSEISITFNFTANCGCFCQKSFSFLQIVTNCSLFNLLWIFCFFFQVIFVPYILCLHYEFFVFVYFQLFPSKNVQNFSVWFLNKLTLIWNVILPGTFCQKNSVERNLSYGKSQKKI